MQILRELPDGVDPLTESPHTLHAVKNYTIAEDQFVCLWVRSEITKNIYIYFNIKSNTLICL